MIPQGWHRTWWVLGWAGVAGIVALSLLPQVDIPGPQVPWQDKWSHLLGWGLVTFWFAQLRELTSIQLRRLFVLALLGGALELAQSVYPHREGDVLDLVANVTGLVLGLVIGRRLAGLPGKGDR